MASSSEAALLAQIAAAEAELQRVQEGHEEEKAGREVAERQLAELQDEAAAFEEHVAKTDPAARAPLCGGFGEVFLAEDEGLTAKGRQLVTVKDVSLLDSKTGQAFSIYIGHANYMRY